MDKDKMIVHLIPPDKGLFETLKYFAKKLSSSATGAPGIPTI